MDLAPTPGSMLRAKHTHTFRIEEVLELWNLDERESSCKCCHVLENVDVTEREI